MDYEKKYKEALERARALHKEAIEKGYVDAYRKDYETIFPELVEIVSEDERTRRVLVKFISDIKSISESGRTSWAIRSGDAKMCETFLTYLEKQKEQKPAEWSEEDEQMCNNICDALGDCGYTAKEINWLKSIRPVKQEWSEEDKKMLKDCIEEVGSMSIRSDVKELRDWLSSLQIRFNLQPKQEWSEVDDEELSRIATERAYDAYPLSNSNIYNNEWNAKRVGYDQGYEQAIRDFGFRKFVRERANNRLKSLRPSWKPSGEQMWALLNAEDLVRANNYPENAKILAELYEQLQKLKGKEEPEYYQHFDPDC